MLNLFAKKAPLSDDDQVELRGFVSSLAEVEWLLLVLVVLYYLAPGTVVAEPTALVGSMVGFALFVIGFNYFASANSFISAKEDHRLKLAISTWVMIAFITWVIWNTGGVQSPLFNLYLLVIIISAMSLGKLTTLLELALMGVAYFYVLMQQSASLTLMEFSRFMVFFAPFALVAWVTSLLAGDIHAGKTLFKSLANTDDMTGLLNKRSLKAELHIAVQMAAQKKHPLTVMMLDADNLKKINDAHGHEAGDKLITHIATILKASLRGSDIVCRYGGDEFVAVLPQMSLQKAVEVSERIRATVAQTPFESRGQQLTTSVSIGFATWPEHCKDLSQLMPLADAGLYESKRKGRNQVSQAAVFRNVS